MAEVKKILITYGEKRSGNYQTVDHSLSVEVELAPGDDPEEVRSKWLDYLRGSVTYVGELELRRLIAESRGR